MPLAHFCHISIEIYIWKKVWVAFLLVVVLLVVYCFLLGFLFVCGLGGVFFVVAVGFFCFLINRFSWLPEALWFGSLGWLEQFAEAILMVARRCKILSCSRYSHWIILLSLHNIKLFWKPVQSLKHYFLHVCICYFALTCFLKQSKLLPTTIFLKGLPKGGWQTVLTHSTFYCLCVLPHSLWKINLEVL